jgi:hypothetical protein
VLLDNHGDQQIVPGVSVAPTGQASVDPALTDVLFDLAIQLEEHTNLPVDVEHVLAAIVLAARDGELDPNRSLSPDDARLPQVLAGYVKKVFSDYGGNVGTEE